MDSVDLMDSVGFDGFFIIYNLLLLLLHQWSSSSWTIFFRNHLLPSQIAFFLVNNLPPCKLPSSSQITLFLANNLPSQIAFFLAKNLPREQPSSQIC
jgi:hypothetical protein